MIQENHQSRMKEIMTFVEGTGVRFESKWLTSATQSFVGWKTIVMRRFELQFKGRNKNTHSHTP
jgi:hypothetical protein